MLPTHIIEAFAKASLSKSALICPVSVLACVWNDLR